MNAGDLGFASDRMRMILPVSFTSLVAEEAAGMVLPPLFFSRNTLQSGQAILKLAQVCFPNSL